MYIMKSQYGAVTVDWNQAPLSIALGRFTVWTGGPRENTSSDDSILSGHYADGILLLAENNTTASNQTAEEFILYGSWKSTLEGAGNVESGLFGYRIDDGSVSSSPPCKVDANEVTWFYFTFANPGATYNSAGNLMTPWVHFRANHGNLGGNGAETVVSYALISKTPPPPVP